MLSEGLSWSFEGRGMHKRTQKAPLSSISDSVGKSWAYPLLRITISYSPPRSVQDHLEHLSFGRKLHPRHWRVWKASKSFPYLGLTRSVSFRVIVIMGSGGVEGSLSADRMS